jgi:hypothetical protein
MHSRSGTVTAERGDKEVFSEHRRKGFSFAQTISARKQSQVISLKKDDRLQQTDQVSKVAQTMFLNIILISCAPFNSLMTAGDLKSLA